MTNTDKARKNIYGNVIDNLEDECNKIKIIEFCTLPHKKLKSQLNIICPTKLKNSNDCNYDSNAASNLESGLRTFRFTNKSRAHCNSENNIKSNNIPAKSSLHSFTHCVRIGAKKRQNQYPQAIAKYIKKPYTGSKTSRATCKLKLRYQHISSDISDESKLTNSSNPGNKN